MRWSADGLMVPTCLFEAASLHKSVLVRCSCRHHARFDSVGLWWHFHRRGWDDHLQAARARFWCRMCRSRIKAKVRPIGLELVEWRSGDVELPPPDARSWKRAMARVR